MPLTLFGLGFKKPRDATGEEIERAKAARTERDEADVARMKQESADAKAAAVAEAGSTSPLAKKKSMTPAAVRMREARLAQKRIKKIKERKLKSATDAAKAAKRLKQAAPKDVDNETHYIDSYGRTRKRKKLRTIADGSRVGSGGKQGGAARVCR